MGNRQPWRVGDVVVGLYEVLAVHGEGGMGLVYRVRHRGWSLDLAVKSPRPELFQTGTDKALFVGEAETWAGLGLHPHVCTCHYVHTIDGIPRVFAEYVEGGSLRDWLRDGRLHQGAPDQVLARILDVAIQVAWGLDHAHRQGVIHQDVKPANILLDPAGTAKVTDFGLAGAQAAVSHRPANPDGSFRVAGIGMTPGYASPEQFAAAPLSRRSDVYSLAVSVLELFTGTATWSVGPTAPVALAALLAAGSADPHLLVPPPRLGDLLARCLDTDRDRRPESMTVLADQLVQVYEHELGRRYPRTAPTVGKARADELNNRGLSLLDLGRPSDAEAAFEQALTADPQHGEATYNVGLLRWRAGRLTDDALVQALDGITANSAEPRRARLLLAQVHLERRDAAAARDVLHAAATDDPELAEVLAHARQAAVDAESQQLTGHAAAVLDVALSADGTRALSVGVDGTVRLWDTADGRCLATLTGGEPTVRSVAFGADGRRALTGGGHLVRLWDLDGGRCLNVLRGHADRVTAVALAADTPRALSGSADRSLRWWDLDSGRCLMILSGHTSQIRSVSLSGDGVLALVASDGDPVRLWDLERRHCLRELPATGGPAAMTRYGRFALTLHHKDVWLWDLQVGGDPRILKGHADDVVAVSFSLDGRRALSSAMDRTVRLWDLASGRCVRTLPGWPDELGATSVGGADGTYLAATGVPDHAVRLWRLSAPYTAPARLCRPRQPVEVVRVQTRADALLDAVARALADARYGPARVLLEELKALPGFERAPAVLAAWRALAQATPRAGLGGVWPGRVLTGHTDRVWAVSLNADGTRALSGSMDGTALLWDLADGRCLRRLDGHDDGVTAVRLSADARRAITAYRSRLRLWDLDGDGELSTLGGHEAVINAVDLTADTRRAISASGDHTVVLWNLDRGRPERTLRGHSAPVTSVRFSADGRRALSGSEDRTLRLWDLNSGQCLNVLSGHHHAVNAVAISPDGRFAVSGSGNGFTSAEEDDFTLRLWDLERDRCLRVLSGHTEPVDGVAISADGRFALSGSWDTAVRVWDLTAGVCLRTLEGHTDGVSSVGFSADDAFAVSAGWDETVRVWQLDWALDV